MNVKIKVTEVTTGMTVQANLMRGQHVVAEIRTQMDSLKNTAKTYSFFNADGVEFFIGRTNAKALVIES